MDVKEMGRLYVVEGWSGGRIAKHAGTTRNAVMGRLHRAGLLTKIKEGRPKPVRFNRPARAIPLADMTLFEGHPGVASVAALAAHHCRWPIGSGFCGHWRADGSSYCPHHVSLSKPQDK